MATVKSSNLKSQISKSKAETTKELALPKEIFNQKPNPVLLHQVITGYLSNQVQSTAHTKTRGQVSGSGKKPWRQKGTGRARAGSIRSPLWIGGGITFGPSPERNFKKVLPKQVRLSALAQALTDRYKNKNLFVIPSLQLEKPSTKKVLEILKKHNHEGKTLFVSTKINNNLVKSVGNVPGLNAVTAQEINALDVLLHKNIIIENSAIAELEKRFKGQS